MLATGILEEVEKRGADLEGDATEGEFVGDPINSAYFIDGEEGETDFRFEIEGETEVEIEGSRFCNDPERLVGEPAGAEKGRGGAK